MKFLLPFRHSHDTLMLGEKAVKIPKLTPEKCKLLIERVETLPQVIMAVVAANKTDDFIATAVAGTTLALDEAISIVAVLADVDADYIEKHADLNEISEFIRAIIEKNDLRRVVSNFQSLFNHFQLKDTSRVEN